MDLVPHSGVGGPAANQRSRRGIVPHRGWCWRNHQRTPFLFGAVDECDGGVLALRGVPALGPEGEFAFLEYVEKAYRETQMG